MNTRRWHWFSIGANGACLLICTYAGVWLMVGWAIVNLAVSTTALRGMKAAQTAKGKGSGRS